MWKLSRSRFIIQPICSRCKMQISTPPPPPPTNDSPLTIYGHFTGKLLDSFNFPIENPVTWPYRGGGGFNMVHRFRAVSVSTQLWTLALGYFRRSEVKFWNTESHCEVVCVAQFHYALSSMRILLKKNYF